MAEIRWLEVSLTVDPELGEAVADVLGRYLAGGVVVESGVIYNDAEDQGTPFGPVRVYGYMAVDDRLEENRRRVEEALWHLGQIQPLPQPQYRSIQDEDWMTAWKQHYHPIPIGRRLLVLPAWIKQTDDRRVAVKIDPSMAFGTGTHPTTQLCLEMVETYTTPGISVIDVGCGSGILSIAALKLGAGQALGVDIDYASVRATRENAAANGINQNLVIGEGSVGEIRQGQFPLQRADLVLANILAPVIVRLFADGLAELAAPGGKLVLSGILVTQSPDVEKAAVENGLQFVEKRQLGDWVALVYLRPASSS